MRIVATLSLVFSLCLLNAQDVYPNILERDSFPGVKSLEISGYLLQFGEEMDTILIPLTQSGFTFNEVGAWTTRAGVFPDGNVSFDSIWYDQKTRTKFIRSANDFDPSLTSITYNAKGQIISELYSPELHEQVMTEYCYNKSGRLVRKSSSFGDQQTVDEYAYDKKGRMITRKQSTGSITGNTTKLDLASVYEYNAIGKLHRTISSFYGAPGVVNRIDTIWYEYDALKRLVVQKESRDSGKSSTITTWEYDDKGRTTAQEYIYNDLEGNYDQVNTYAEYDSMGYCRNFSDNGSGYTMGLVWKTTYNEKGLPVSCIYTTDTEVILYKWEYVMR